MAAVTLEAVHKSYGKNHIVRGVSLTVADGSFLSLLGPSGCGKTTTLRMIAGLERLDSGRIAIGGGEVDGPAAHVPPERRGLGMVFQSYAVWPHRTVAENVAYPLERQGLNRSERDARIREALAQVRLEAFADRQPHALSGGQLQRVALARALVGRPKVLLLDEPLSNLDAALKEELRAEIAALRARLGTTMIAVTHDQAEALALADQVAVMRAGVLEQVATPQALYAEPNSPFVAGFVGGANVLDGEVRGGAFVLGGVRLELPTAVGDGPCTLVLRPEDAVLEPTGTLPLAARLFLGATTEYRLQLGDVALRVLGPPHPFAQPGTTVGLTLRAARVFPRELR
ncbi:MAG: ABC transporter ATP-binding protein [Myxococcaceae bacterium]|nr:ABC transporter ATP-binding protein [Myxococcaceae bacterium]